MAEKAAHFSFTTETKPSIFEVIAQHSLNATLYPALQKVAEFLVFCNPKCFQWLTKYYDESFLILNGLLQYYYITNHHASFSEYFYGMQRQSIKATGYFMEKQKRLSLVILVLVPYITVKIKERLGALRLQEVESPSKDFNGFLRKQLLWLHSTCELSWKLWMLLNYIRYMSDETKSQLPSLSVIKLRLVYAAQQEDVAAFWSALFRGKLNFKEISFGLVQNGLRTSLEIGAFFIQFLQVWNREKSTYDVTALPSVPAPQPDAKAKLYENKCPICLQKWKIPTALPVSGYVFCFPCILRYLRENQRCPVTSLPSKPLDIIRLYDT